MWPEHASPQIINRGWGWWSDKRFSRRISETEHGAGWSRLVCSWQRRVKEITLGSVSAALALLTQQQHNEAGHAWSGQEKKTLKFEAFPQRQLLKANKHPACCFTSRVNKVKEDKFHRALLLRANIYINLCAFAPYVTTNYSATLQADKKAMFSWQMRYSFLWRFTSVLWVCFLLLFLRCVWVTVFLMAHTYPLAHM